MSAREIRVYIDYKSPYAYLAQGPAYALEAELGVALRWLPYTLDIPSYLGSVEGRSAQQWRKVRYAYMDARRFANRQGLTLRGPRKIFDSSIANIGLLYASAEGVARGYSERVFERFWRRELDIEDRGAVRAVLAEAGADAAGFFAYLDGEGRRELARLQDEAEALGVFGVPTFVVDGELFWGQDRLALVRERLAAAGG